MRCHFGFSDKLQFSFHISVYPNSIAIKKTDRRVPLPESVLKSKSTDVSSPSTAFKRKRFAAGSKEECVASMAHAPVHIETDPGHIVLVKRIICQRKIVGRSIADS